MKYLKYTLVLAVFVSSQIVAQETATKNYVKNTTYQVATTDGNVATDDKIETITYYDGLGRTEQTRAKQAGGNKEDIISPIVYDGFGRQTLRYLPDAYSVSSDLYYLTPATLISSIESYYSTNFPDDINSGAPNPYSESAYDGSPLNRVLQQAAPGEDWEIGSDHEIDFEYHTNVTEEVKRYDVSLSFANDTYTPQLSLNGSDYPENTLSKTITKDENWTSGTNQTTEEFKDKSGRVILKRTYADISSVSTTHDTYYVYDDYGNLSYVLPPLSNPDDGIPSGQELDDLCYQYIYDVRNRLVEKKVPGKGWEYIVYNNIDQPILTQDQNLKLNNDWLFTKYDAFGRVAYTGLMGSSSSRTTLQNAADATSLQFVTQSASSSSIGGTNIYYSDNSNVYPTSGITEVYTVSYYDVYDSNILPAGLSSTVTTFKNLTSTTDTEGLPTISKVKVLETSNWITTVSYYDDKARPIYVYNDNPYLGTEDVIETDLDFTGKPDEIKTTHTKDTNPVIVTYEEFVYDHAGRLISQKQEIDGEPQQLISENHYDGLGQLYQKGVGGETVFDGYTDMVGVEINEFTDVIVKTGANGWNSGAATTGKIFGDGYIEFTPDQSNKSVMVGLSASNTNANYNTIKYAIYARANGEVRVYENGSNKGTFSTYIAGDVLRVERVGNTVFYKKNGSTIYTSSVTSSGSLIGDLALYHNGTSISNVKIGHSTSESALQTVDYNYNVRGWLKEINNVDNIGSTDLFAFEIFYNDATHSLSTDLFNGNISQVKWKSANSNSSVLWYIYNYDDLNRITDAQFRGAGWSDRYSLENIDYDKNGNITALLRKGHIVDQPDENTSSHFSTMDNLVYTYQSNSNQLQKVLDNGNDNYGFKDGDDSTTEYNYDANGNMTMDLNKGIAANGITYNHLNLPTQVTMASGNIQYIYDATGIKLEKTVSTTGDITKYAGNYIYKDTGSGDVLEFFNHAEGYIVPDGSSGYDYVYQYKDHLGNIRLSYKDTNGDGVITAASEILEENNYYPFGLKHKGYNNTPSGVDHKYGFGGKEEQDDDVGGNKLDWLDFSARNYDAALGRWMNLDPLAELMTRHSPYNYAFDNPIFFIDADGMAPAGFGGIVSFADTPTGEDGCVDENKNGICDSEEEDDDDDDDSNDMASLNVVGMGNSANDVELAKNKANSNLGCQQGDCYDPADLKNDSPEIIYNKLLNNLITFVKARNEASEAGLISVGVTLEEIINLDDYGELDKSKGAILDETIKYKGGTIQIVVHPNEDIAGYHFAGRTRRMFGDGFFFSYEVWFLASYKKNVKDWESTGRKAKTINIRFSNVEHYNSFVRAYNEGVYGKQ